MDFKEIVKVNVERIIKKDTFNFPLTFICGYTHFKELGIVNPKRGFIVYIIKECNCKGFDKENFPKLDRVEVIIIPNEVSYLRYMKIFIDHIISCQKEDGLRDAFVNMFEPVDSPE